MGELAYTVQRVLCRPMPEEPAPVETLLLAQCLEGGHAGALCLVRCLEGPPDAPLRQRAWDGASLAVRMRHPHVGGVWLVHSDEDVLLVVSEYVPGFDLQSVLSFAAIVRQPPSPAFACFVGAAVADALDYIHHLQNEKGQWLGIVHRGVHPENIRLGLGGEVKLTGFDVTFSRVVGRRLTTTNLVRGELAYAAPEYVRDCQLDFRSDFFSLGMVLLELLTGRYPFDVPAAVMRARGDLRAERSSWLPLEELVGHLKGFGPEAVGRAARGVSDTLVAILGRALQLDPGGRYQRGAWMRDDLRDWLHGQPVHYGPEEAVAEMRALRDRSQHYAPLVSTVEPGALPGAEEAS
ncbi:serine/threonine protein kinase [Vitiosangium sp. GDMCC 1.1324]|nr:serine/threonine protein kinase [Vitiosangium sp. GDMCC 1.1324]